MKRLALLVVGLLLTAVMLPAAAQTDYLARYADVPQSRTEDGAFVLGNPDAPVTIVEFADFMCPHCQEYQPTINKFIDDYVLTGLAKFEYRFYPIVHPTYSVFTAQIAECAEVQKDGGFWAAHDMLYDLAGNGQVGPDSPEAVASALGIDSTKLETCIESAVQHETDSALADAIGASGTPAVTIRLPDGTLGWPYLHETIRNSGGLPIALLREIVAAPDLASIVIVPKALLSDLVTEATCIVTCWRSIIPGETPFEDVADIIRADRQNIEISVDAADDGTQAVTWRTFDSVLNDSNYIVAADDGTVDVISLLDVSQYGLGDVLAVQGEPEYALAVANDAESALFYAIYPQKALIVLAFLSTADGLTEETTVVGAQYYSPAAMTDLLSRADAPAWMGYDALDSYMR